MEKLFFVGLGGFIGSILRFAVVNAVTKFFKGSLPYGTLLVNISGCFLIGLLITSLQEKFTLFPQLRFFLVIGILGGFTTFSAFSFETIELLQAGYFSSAFLNIFYSLAGCLIATWLGIFLGKSL